MDNISVQDKELDQLLERVNKALLKEATGSQEEQDIKDWVYSTIDDWRTSWDDSKEGAESARYDLETAEDWFLNNLDEFEETYGYSLDTDAETLLSTIASGYANEVLNDIQESWDHFDDSEDDEDEDDIWDEDEEDDDDEYWNEVHASFGESQSNTESRIQEYKYNETEQLFNRVDNLLKETDAYLVSKGYKQFQEAEGGITPQDVIEDYIQIHPEAQGQAQTLLNQLNQIIQNNPKADVKAEFDKLITKNSKTAQSEKAVTKSEDNSTAPLITNQDIKLSQNYLIKALSDGDIPKKINQLLPKISPTFKGDNFNITKVTRVPSKNPSSIKFQVNFNLQSRSKKADKFLDSQDPVINKTFSFLTSLQEEQFSEGVLSAIGSAVGKVIGGTKQELATTKNNFINGAQPNINLSNYQAAEIKEPMLAQYLQKVFTQIFQDTVPINGKNFDISISGIKTEKDAGADAQFAALQKKAQEEAETAQAAKDQKVTDSQVKKDQKAADKQAKKDQKAADQQFKKDLKQSKKIDLNSITKANAAKANQTVENARNVAALRKAKQQGADLNKKSQEIAKSLLGESQKPLTEGLLVKDGSFTIEMVLAGANNSGLDQLMKNEPATKQESTEKPVEKPVEKKPVEKTKEEKPVEKPQVTTQFQQAQVTQQQATQQPNGQSINIYNGVPQGQQAAAQQTGIPDWKNLSRGQKKFLRKAQKANTARTLRNNRNGNFTNNVWDLTYGNGGKYGRNWA